MYWLLIIFLLIPQIASAQSAWVHWKRFAERNKDSGLYLITTPWLTEAAFDTRKECINRMLEFYKEYKVYDRPGSYHVTPDTPKLTDNKMVFYTTWPASSVKIFSECWPSNIKPSD